jgi:predicted ATPase
VYHFGVIRRFYVHNFRCLENFELPIGGRSSVLLIGKNGSGKSTVALALEIIQKIARGTNQVSDLIGPQDRSRGRADVPVRFEIEVELDERVYAYSVAFELPPGSTGMRVFEENLTMGGKLVFAREIPGPLAGITRGTPVLAPHLVALPILEPRSTEDPLFIFRQWAARMLILRPAPSRITGDSGGDTLEPNPDVANFGGWFSGLLSLAPSAYAEIDKYLRQVMPDFSDIRSPLTGTGPRKLIARFVNDRGSVEIPFGDLSDGEKCFMICSLVHASAKAYGPVFCFWDEPDNYLAISEVGDFVIALRRTFQSAGQFVATSHNSEAIRCFSHENTLLLYRNSHLEPTIVRPVSELQVNGNLVSALIRDDVEP